MWGNNMELPKTRRMGVIVEPKVAEVHEEPIGEMGPDDVFVKMLTCNICTTDYQQWDGKRNHMGFPMAAGHEWCGEVIAVGDNVSVYKVGDYVGPCGGRCGHCIPCRMGQPTGCTAPHGPHPIINGYRGGRGFSNFSIRNQDELVKMNKLIPAHLCSFLEPLSAAINGMRKLRAQPGENIVVVGAGTMGMMNALAAHAYGARVIITELSDKKLARARDLGWADVIDSRECDPVEKVFELTDGVGADAVTVCVGLTAAYNQAYKMLKQSDGRFLLFSAGHPKPEMDMDPNEVHYRRSEIIGTIGADVQDVALAAKLINAKLVDAAFGWEGVTYGLKDLQEAYKHATKPDMYRVTVDLQDI